MTDVAQLIERQTDGFGLEAELYHAPAVFAAEFARIFRCHWLFVGHSCELPDRGDFCTWQIGDDPLLVVRGEDGTIRALHNVCRHRGSLVCERERGRAARLVCPYHGWTYGLDGRLLKAPGISAADRARFGLKSAQAEEVCGLIFVNLAERPEPIDALRAHFEPILAPQGLERAKVASSVDYDLPVNWKTVIENNRECLHCPANHRLYVSVTYDVDNHDPDRQVEIEARVAECRDALGRDGAGREPGQRVVGCERALVSRQPHAGARGLRHREPGRPAGGPADGRVHRSGHGHCARQHQPQLLVPRQQRLCEHGAHHAARPGSHAGARVLAGPGRCARGPRLRPRAGG